MKKNIDYYVVRCCILILILFFISYFFRITARAYIKVSGKTNKVIQMILFDRNDLSDSNKKIGDSFDWKTFYPFGETFQSDKIPIIVNRTYLTKQNFQENIEETEQKSSIKNFKIINKIIDFEEKIKNKGKKVETWITENCIKRYFFLEKANQIEAFFKWNLSNDSYNATENIGNGHFSGFCKETNIDILAKSIIRFSYFLENENIPFIYVQAPYKICKYDEKYSGIHDFSNQNADAVIANLLVNKVDVLDLRELIHLENKNHYDLFFKTDHHWKPETGVWAAQKIIEKIDSKTNLKLKSFYDDDYDYKLYKKALLGSYGKKITLAKTKPDDFMLILPKKEYEIHFEAFDKHNKIADNFGNFNAMIDFENINSKDFYGKDPYHAYCYGSSNNFVENKTVNNNYKILLVGDSFTNVVLPFIAQTTRYIYRFDLRYFTGSLESYIKINGPYDLCIALYNPAQYNQTPGFVTHEELFDFR